MTRAYLAFASPDLARVSVASRVGPVWPRISPPIANLPKKRDHRKTRTVTKHIPVAPPPVRPSVRLHEEGANDLSSFAVSPVEADLFAVSPVEPYVLHGKGDEREEEKTRQEEDKQKRTEDAPIVPPSRVASP